MELQDNKEPKGSATSLMNSVTQDMKYRQSLMQYAEKHGVSAASRKYKKVGPTYTFGGKDTQGG